MGKFDHLKEDDEISEFSPQENYDDRDELHGVVSKGSFNFIQDVNKATIGIMGDEWISNVQRNKKHWDKQAKIMDMIGLGKNKAVIGIGSGPSFKKNEHVLREYVIPDGLKPWKEREFITIAANHQFKPLLEMGIIPDFVLLVDSAITVKNQLIKGIPKIAKNTQLITGIHVSPEILSEWSNQGRGIVFFTTPSMVLKDASKYAGMKGFEKQRLGLGGNVLNGAFIIGSSIFQSTVFMGVANDLSFELNDDVDKQRNSYYSDGDYSSNAEVTGSGRDEGKSEKRWAGYSMEKKKIISITDPIIPRTRYNFNLDVVGTSHTLWVYKTWLESTMMVQTKHPVHLHYFNCTEGGILGVLAKSEEKEDMRKPENWYFMDDVCINKHTGKQMYMTAMLEDAIEVFLKARRSQSWDNSSALYARDLEV